MPPMTQGRPRLVRGRVTRHEPYGFYVDIGANREGVVVITMISDDPSVSNSPFPPIGSTISAALIGYTDVGDEPRLSVRPSDVKHTE